jgi:hypothetical protein
MIVRKKFRNRDLKGKARRGTTITTKVEVQPKSKYMGSSLTVFNRREFGESKKEQYIQMHTEKYEARKKEILSLEGTEEEKQAELKVLDEQQLSPEQLEKRAVDFARYEVNKEQKHFKAYCKGQNFFRYQGMMHPVLTEEFLLKAKGLKEIHNLEDEQVHEDNGSDGQREFESADLDPIHTSDEGRVSETV